MQNYRALLGPVMVVVLILIAVRWSPFEPHRPPAYNPEFMGEVEAGPPSWMDEDWARFDATVRWAFGEGVHELPLGEAMVAIGRSLVGTAYVPQTLEVEGPERLVINFRGLDCVTFVENTFALARLIRATGRAFDGDADAVLANRGSVEHRYEALIAEMRYRDGQLGAYPSRLHYFADWISDNARRGLVEDVTEALGGVRDDEPIDFMSTHTDAYRQLSDPAFVDAVRAAEERLTATGRVYIPQERIAEVADRIQDGDIIAATSTVQGLDVAHTGIAIRIDGRLHLMHAPLVGEEVQISERTLAERIQAIGGQDGIIVARPLDRGAEATSGGPSGGGA